MPIFFALYGLLNKFFVLRGATFIPGWIDDLSAPEYIFQFPGDFTLPLLNWDAIRLLPFLYVGTQFLMTWTMQGNQPAAQQGGMNTKMMTYGMPIMFFFILYNMPSGLLLYWTAMNILTFGQQMFTNWRKKQKAMA